MLFNKMKKYEGMSFIVKLAILITSGSKNNNTSDNDNEDSNYVLLLDKKILRSESDAISEWSELFDNENKYLSSVKEISDENEHNFNIWDKSIFSYNPLQDNLNEASLNVIKKYSENKEIKQRVIQILLSEDIDIMKLTPDIIQTKLLSLPETQCDIILETMKIVVNENNELVNNLSSGERKRIIFEFIRLMKKLNISNLSDSLYINCLFSTFNVGKDYLSEFEDIVCRYSKLDCELLEIITE